MSVNIDNIKIEEPPHFSPSLLVPNVQEMVKMNPLQVPTKYMRKLKKQKLVKDI